MKIRKFNEMNTDHNIDEVILDLKDILLELGESGLYTNAYTIDVSSDKPREILVDIAQVIGIKGSLTESQFEKVIEEETERIDNYLNMLGYSKASPQPKNSSPQQLAFVDKAGYDPSLTDSTYTFRDSMNKSLFPFSFRGNVDNVTCFRKVFRYRLPYEL